MIQTIGIEIEGDPVTLTRALRAKPTPLDAAAAVFEMASPGELIVVTTSDKERHKFRRTGLGINPGSAPLKPNEWAGPITLAAVRGVSQGQAHYTAVMTQGAARQLFSPFFPEALGLRASLKLTVNVTGGGPQWWAMSRPRASSTTDFDPEQVTEEQLACIGFLSFMGFETFGFETQDSLFGRLLAEDDDDVIVTFMRKKEIS
jgi:hypothetical protein